MGKSCTNAQICHYTNFDVLKSIIENKCFWAYSTISQKDQSEVKYGFEYIKNNPKVPLSFRKQLAGYIDKPCWDNYVICFSYNRNCSKMWKNYTKDKKSGISFVFDEKKLLDAFMVKLSASKMNKKLNLYTPEFLVCQYSDDSTYLSSYFDKKIDEWSKKYRKKSIASIEIGIMFEDLIGLAYAIKHKKYEYEGEKRIILPPTVTSFLSEKEFCGKKYVELPFDITLFLDSIVAIDISPEASKGCKEDVKRFLTQYKEDLSQIIIQC